MFQSAIDLQTFADLFEDMTGIVQADTGPVMTTTARHPALGSCVVIQDIIHPGVIMLSELPIRAIADI